MLIKSQELPDSKFIKHWTYACIVNIGVILNYLLFEANGNEIDTFNTFRKYINRLNKEKVFEIIKLLASQYLIAFKRNKDNIKFLKCININIKNFESEVFSFFSFTYDDKKTFRELDKEFDGDPAVYFLHLCRKIFEKAYDISDEENLLPASLLMSHIISNTYNEIFLNTLKNSLKNK
ncbi:hypothetical protein [Thermoanaerobacterium thermosaccharolyticum]|uniref:hypothetical protein n=1 Tax=Thermoanaerobacterium thermosaccharolyticum TaxID=1517 RepID=UPI003DA914B7